MFNLTELALFPFTFLALAGSSLMAGIFFTFSNFVMKALKEIPFPAGMKAMQSINRVVLNPFFLGLFFITAVLAFILAIKSFTQWQQPYATYTFTASLFYFIGTFLVTAIKNVPLNNKLASIPVENKFAESSWQAYLYKWTRWNHVRTISSLAATVLYTPGFVYIATN